ncbi:hypothetical protein E2F43_18655 [Seongchinamella unica]|uniref:Uncharacterized protein n=1 Tax=Seongchinamella unica TaxID=2547392 RepID=A0A4R5LMW0_9GAMM|nr:hypothetical protein [Seongchinamella unica]TDG11406.1 hypothetical protein E2F43_18655 [Seongchinamella unica]
MSNTRLYLYLSLIPQGLIASMLEPEEFGHYYAVGTRVHSRGEAIFFEVDPAGVPADEFPLELIGERCVAHPDGNPKKSVYLAIYRVLSRIPVSALRKLYLVTRDGLTLELARSQYEPEPGPRAHLYQEFCPIDPMVASCLEPRDFCRAITDPSKPVHVPRIAFSQLALGGLAEDPLNGEADDLPYPNMQHLREILSRLLEGNSKPSKLFLKRVDEGVYYRTIRGGFYVGDQQDFAFYRFPSVGELEAHHFPWWRSAQTL